MDRIIMEGHRQSPVSEEHRELSTSPNSLPADDGMRQLRLKIHEIRELAASTTEKANRIHALMTEEYITATKRRNSEPAASPAAIPTADAGVDTDNYKLKSEDLQPSFHPDNEEKGELDELLEEEESIPIYGCVHYKRNVKVQCYDCHLWFPCRHCHDASPDLPYQHLLDRKKTENMLCMLCATPQTAGEACINCGHETAYYYCPKCKLWDNDSTKSIYHCDDCGICRRGEGLGKDYVHCKRCNVCISISTSSTHPCIERATDCNCPLCLDYLFSSSTPVVSLFCGHYMHASCYKDLMNVTYRCPVCSKSAVNMELQWRKLDDEIRMQPMPEEEFVEDEDEEEDGTTTPDLLRSTDSRLAGGLRGLRLVSTPRPRTIPKRVWIGCNDCGGRGWSNFHWLGLKCPVCDGYNTNQMTPIGDRSHTPIPGTQLQRQHDFTGIGVVRAFGGGLDPAELTIDERADSAYGTASSPSQYPAPPQSGTPVPTSRSYFLQADEAATTTPNPRPESSASLPEDPPRFGSGISHMPYDFLQNVGRSLSPMRYYLEGFDANVRDRAMSASRRMSEYAASMIEGKRPANPLEGQPKRPRSIAEGEQVDFWGGDGQFLSGGEEDEKDDEADGGSESGSEGSEDEDDDDDSAGSDLDLGEGDVDLDGEDEMELFGHR